MTHFPTRLVMIFIFIVGAVSLLPAQNGLSLTVDLGGQYLLPKQGPKQEALWHNAQSGFHVNFGAEYQLGQFWAGLSLSPSRQSWESGPGSPLWPGREKPVHHSRGWWSISSKATVGHRIPLGKMVVLSPYVGIGYDWQQSVRYCGVGSTLSKDLTVPVSHATAETLVPSSLFFGGGMYVDYQIGGEEQPLWVRFGVSGWGRSLPLLTGRYFLWKDGGRMAQQPPWGPPALRPGQRQQMEDCPELPFTVDPDESHDISLPGHALIWSVGVRIPL